MDLLPKDYPLLVSDDRKDVVEKIEYAKSIFGTTKWSELLDIHKGIKERTSLDGGALIVLSLVVLFAGPLVKLAATAGLIWGIVTLFKKG